MHCLTCAPMKGLPQQTALDSVSIKVMVNIEHCGARVSKQYIVVLNCYIAKVYVLLKCEVTAHQLWHLGK